MNNAHFHLVVNHLPMVSILIAVLVLIAGIVFKKTEVKLTALGILIFAAVASPIALNTGEGAEDIVENLEGVSEALIHTHEEYAESFNTLTLILGGLALLTFVAEIKKISISKYLMLLCLTIAIADGVLASYVGTSGGEIRHSEIREDANKIPSAD